MHAPPFAFSHARVFLLIDHLQFFVSFLDPPASKVIADVEKVALNQETIVLEIQEKGASYVHGNLIYAFKDDIMQVVVAVHAENAVASYEFTADLMLDKEGR